MILVIAEKPSVAQTIAAALGAKKKQDGYIEGDKYLISWCVGHLVQLADAAAYGEQYKKWSYDSLPILPQEWQYTVSADKGKQFATLKNLMHRTDISEVVNACDAGREGELIFRFVYEVAGCKKPMRRLWISSMEESAIKAGFENLKDGRDYDALFASALCRAKADWIIGINATRLFSCLYNRTLNVGRVQTPTLKMLVDRDAAISTFKKEKYYHVRLNLSGAEAASGKICAAEEAKELKAACEASRAVCTSLVREKKTAAPPKLFDLTSLQREANRIFGYTAKQTLDLAQALYEKKLLTYPRTDSSYLTAGQEQPDKEETAAPEQPKQEAPAQEKAAFTPETIYRVRRNPYSDSKDNTYLLQAYVTQENGRAKMSAVLFTGTPQKCRELMGQLKSGELTEGQVKELYAKAQETAKTAEQDKDTYSIYQLKHGDETRDLRFEPYDRLQVTGNVVDKANYELIYSAELTPGTSLEDIYTRFNIDHPKDFKGHSLSVSDVVVLHQDGQDTAHYVDSFGYKSVPEFLQEQKQLTPDELETGETIKTPRGTFYVTDMSREQMEAAGYGFHHQSDDGKYLVMGNGTRAFAIAAEQAQRENPLKAAEQTTEQNENMIDEIINNTPSVDELEAKVKAGETISLVDLANAVKADKERGKGKQEKKPSIRAQLKADKEKAQKKAAVKTKNHDLEV